MSDGKGFPLPDNLDPTGERCIIIRVPDDVQWYTVVFGFLTELGYWYNWQRDPLKRGAIMAQKFRDIVNVSRTEFYGEGCPLMEFDVRQNEELPCKLEKQIDGGAWEEFADLQLCPPRIRTNEGRLQWWDGTQWVDVPGEGDERFDGEYEPPFPDPPPGETGNCLAAENITALLQQQVTEWVGALTAGAIALGIVTIITGVLSAFFIPYATPALLGFATTLIGIGASGLSSEFTSAVYDRFKCIIYCNAASDGSITVSQYEDIVADVQAETGTAWDLIEVWLTFFGNVGLNRAATSAGITDGDCVDCDPCGDITITMNSGTCNKTAVNVGDTFIVQSAPAPGGGCPDDEYLDMALSIPCMLEVLSLSGSCPSCQNGPLNNDWILWSGYPGGQWYHSTTPATGVYGSATNRAALWSCTHMTITYKVLSV